MGSDHDIQSDDFAAATLDLDSSPVGEISFCPERAAAQLPTKVGNWESNALSSSHPTLYDLTNKQQILTSAISDVDDWCCVYSP